MLDRAATGHTARPCHGQATPPAGGRSAQTSGAMNRQPTDHQRSSLMLRCAAVYFGIVFGVGFLLGAVRVLFLVPRIGERSAELAEMPLMFIAVFLAAGYLVRRYGGMINAGRWVLVGVIALGLLVCAELLLAVVLAGRGVADYLASRDPVSGSVYVAMLLVYAAMPWLRRGLGGAHSGGHANGA